MSNTLITLSDNKIGIDNNADNKADFYTASVLSATDYYAFGMSMKERSWQSESYRYGFNGKENDTDWDVQDYGFRIYKPELGKFLSVDPLSASYPWYTPYQFAGNMPIQAIDLDGLEEYKIVGRSFAPRGSFEGTQFESDGDDRTKFQISNHKEISARIHVIIKFNMTNPEKSLDYDISSQNSILKGGSILKELSIWPVTDQGIRTTVTKKQKMGYDDLNIKSEYFAKNGTDVGPAIDIQFDITINAQTGSSILVIDTHITGNIFPAQETMIFDEKGTGLFLGTSTAIGGPLTGVWEDGKENTLSSEYIHIKIDKKGNFLGVYMKDKNNKFVLESPDEYNKRFTDKEVWNEQNKRDDYEEKND